MKKIILMALVASLAFAGSAFAGVASITSAGTTIGGQQFNCSNNVTLSVYSVAAEYTAISKHSSGDRQYGTNEVASIIYWEDSETLDTAAAATDFSAWNKM